jgi:hypothetical protein
LLLGAINLSNIFDVYMSHSHSLEGIRVSLRTSELAKAVIAERVNLGNEFIIKKTTKKLFMMAFLASNLVLQGCAMTPIGDEGLEALTDGNVVRATVNWDEKSDRAFAPASYNVEANYHHWVVSCVPRVLRTGFLS